MIYSDCKETLCTGCSYREVCSLKDEFMEAQQAVNDVSISCPCSDGKKIGMVRLRDIKWIKPVELVCNHYSKNATSIKRDV